MVCLFALLMTAIFVIFLSHLPVRVVTPQIARLRYYACQNGIFGGPLSSSLNEFDWRKAFIWKASDTEYRQRQVPQFFEVLTPRIYAHLYYWFGPFMWLPLCLVMVVIIAGLIFLIVRQWTGDWLPGLVAGSFWLMTPEVLVGHHAPMRYAKDFVTIEILGIIVLFLAIREKGRRRAWLIGICATVIWAIGLFTDEYILFTLPAFVVALLTWPWLKSLRVILIISFFLLTAISLYLFINILPGFISPDIKKPLARLSLSAWPGFGSLFIRNIRYLLLNTWDNLSYTFGGTNPQYPVQIIPAACSGIALIFTALVSRAWKGWGKMIVFWAVTTVAVGGILLPEGNDILHQITYYNRPLIALLMIVLGLFTANIFRSHRYWPTILWLTALIICAITNLFIITISIQDDPEEAYLTRYGLNNITQLHSRLRSNDLKQPVFVSYPRFPEPVNAVYEELEWITSFTLDNGFPWSLYRSIMPRLYLRHFEEGELRANPKQFARWAGADEHAYRSAANYFYDMPEGVVWDLDAIQKNMILPGEDILWKSFDGRKKAATLINDLLGAAPFVSLEAGKWHITLPMPREDKPLVMIFAIRHDEKTVFSVPEALNIREEICSYRWAFQIFNVEIKPGVELVHLFIKTSGDAEVIGPILVPLEIASPVPPSARKNIPLAGVPLLELRGVTRD